MRVDLILKRRNKPYMNSSPFREYTSTVLLPYIDELRSNEESTNTETVLLMTNCSIHVQREILQMLAKHQVNVVTFPPHTSHIF
jgi:transposase